MSLPAELVDENLSRGEPDFAPGPIDMARLTAEHVSILAEELAGVSRVGSPREYRTARRKVERWRRGAKPGPRSQPQLAAARRSGRDRIRRFRAHGGHMRIKVQWGSAVSVRKGRRAEWLPPQKWVAINKTVMRRAIREWARGEIEEAADQLFVEFLQQYGVPQASMLDWLADAEVTDLRLEPQR